MGCLRIVLNHDPGSLSRTTNFGTSESCLAYSSIFLPEQQQSRLFQLKDILNLHRLEASKAASILVSLIIWRNCKKTGLICKLMGYFCANLVKAT